MKRTLVLAILSLGALAGAAFAQTATTGQTPEAQARLVEKVRHELVMMAWYSVFDHIEFSVEGRTVTLAGAVNRPSLRSEAAARVRAIEGVEVVANQIRVLPLSPFDDRIRLASWRAIYGHPAFSRAALAPLAGLHLVVENGTLTLRGVVSSEAERNLAGILANGVSGVFAVNNELKVAGRT